MAKIQFELRFSKVLGAILEDLHIFQNYNFQFLNPSFEQLEYNLDRLKFQQKLLHCLEQKYMHEQKQNQ